MEVCYLPGINNFAPTKECLLARQERQHDFGQHVVVRKVELNTILRICFRVIRPQRNADMVITTYALARVTTDFRSTSLILKPSLSGQRHLVKREWHRVNPNWFHPLVLCCDFY